jgi:hypothetical protein
MCGRNHPGLTGLRSPFWLVGGSGSVARGIDVLRRPLELRAESAAARSKRVTDEGRRRGGS